MIVKILLGLAIVLVSLFVLSLVIYFFNLDMKAAALLMPLFEKHYDRVDRKKERQKAKERQKVGGRQEAGGRQETEGQQKAKERQDDAAI